MFRDFHSKITAFPPQADAIASGPRAPSEQIVALGVLLAAIVLAYFYVVDKFFLSTHFMSPIFLYLLMLDDFNTVWVSFGVCVLAAFWRYPNPLFRVADTLGEHVRLFALMVTAALALAAISIYHSNPFSMDEYAAVFQAKVFAAGKVVARLPPSVIDWLVPPGFNGAFLVASKSTGKAIEAYWPGFSLLLAPFEFLHVPWLCNACLAGLSILLIHRITFEITSDRRAAGWALLFTVASGAFIANAISFYSMQAHLTANLLFAWLLMRPDPKRAFAAGMAGSVALMLHNPFPHAMFALPWVIAIARSERIPRNLLWLALGYLPLIALVGAGWIHLRTDIIAGNSGFNAMITSNLNSVFSIPDGPMIDMRAAAVVKMWIWAPPCLFLFAVLGRLHWREDQRVRLLASSAVVTFVGYLFVIFDQGHGWGYRYFHSAWGVVPILAGCAMARSASNDRLAAFAGAAAILNILLVLPLQLSHIEAIIHRHIVQIPTAQRPGNNVYFIRGDSGFYAADLVQMDPFLRQQDLLLLSRGPELDSELRRQNWPTAKLARRVFGVEEWHLGSQDQHSIAAADSDRFDFTYTNNANLP